MRLDKYLSYALSLSRRDSRELINLGRIRVNEHKIYKKDFCIDEYHDQIFLDDELLTYHKFVYLMMNKPQGYLSATKDDKLPTVLDLIAEYKKHNLFIVGRLDIDTEGFLLLTNDGKFAYNITKPSNNVGKMYYLEIDGEFTKNDILLCQEGLMIKDGKGRFLKTKPGELKIIKQSKAYLTIYEGKYHQVKQMCNQLGKPLLYLRRERIGTINLDSNLQLGEYRLLTNQEIEEFKKQFT